jgi:peptidoglycan glycosyltransferase
MISRQTTLPPTVRDRIHRLLLVVLLAFAGVAVSLVYWSVVRTPAILAREDNPRLVEAELRIRRGRILDVHNVLLAETIGQGNQLVRHYPMSQIGPAVGYYSFRHGTSGIEEGLNAILRGDSLSAWEMNRRQLYHEAQTGFDVRLTLNADWQQQATTLMGDHQGALVLLALPDAAIRVMVSLPGYDPNLLDEQFDALALAEQAPLLNRVTQGQYQPGMLLQPFLFAAALDEGLFRLNDPVNTLTETVRVANQTSGCEVPATAEPTFRTALQYACPAPTQELRGSWNATALDSIFAAFGLKTPPLLPINTDVPPSEPVQNIPLALIGQENLTVTPLQIALAYAALANRGEPYQPQLVSAVQMESGEWQAYMTRPRQPLTPAVSSAAATSVLQSLTIEQGVAGQSYVVFSGPQGSQDSWYVGMTPIANPRYVVVVLLEGESEASAAAAVGQSLLQIVMASP